MIHDHPVFALFHECKAITRRQRLGFAVLAVRKGVVARVDRGARLDEVVTQRRAIRSHGRRESSLEHCIRSVEKNNLVRIVLSQSLGPFQGRGGNLLLGPGRGDGWRSEQAASEYKQQSRSQSPEFMLLSSSSIKNVRISGRATPRTPDENKIKPRLAVASFLKFEYDNH
jgi:hypothetical protein